MLAFEDLRGHHVFVWLQLMDVFVQDCNGKSLCKGRLPKHSTQRESNWTSSHEKPGKCVVGSSNKTGCARKAFF